ncbi:unnamed protein product [Cuscuta campestris]|uniref:Uncharacterized protein n=1 Tax=Cuscuta campestris TaxID=132261 RepID=A0A484KKY6_9ASTE|nr:unnamed protein product [Cuscuta campestris]
MGVVNRGGSNRGIGKAHDTSEGSRPVTCFSRMMPIYKPLRIFWRMLRRRRNQKERALDEHEKEWRKNTSATTPESYSIQSKKKLLQCSRQNTVAQYWIA